MAYTHSFQTLGVTFSLHLKSLYELNFVPKLQQLERSLNCWKHRSLSLVGRITVIKAMVLPQLLYLFSVLCIPLPKSFFKRLNGVFFKFIWNEGNDRVKRSLLYVMIMESACGLRMIDPEAYALAQKMVWVKHLLDPEYNSSWKSLEIFFLTQFHPDQSVLWKADAPDCLLNKLSNCQLKETFVTWYFYRKQCLADLDLRNYHLQDSIWWNKGI